jgi:hypothetical protein
MAAIQIVVQKRISEAVAEMDCRNRAEFYAEVNAQKNAPMQMHLQKQCGERDRICTNLVQNQTRRNTDTTDLRG